MDIANCFDWPEDLILCPLCGAPLVSCGAYYKNEEWHEADKIPTSSTYYEFCMRCEIMFSYTY